MEKRDEFAAKLQAFMAVASALRKTIDAPWTEKRPLYPYLHFGFFLNGGRDAAIASKARAAKRPQSLRAAPATEASPPFAPRKRR